jgi:hypothetical protein
MHVQHPHAEARRRGTRLRDGVRDIVELEIEEDVKPRATIQRTGSGPATTNISLPTLSAQRAGSSRSASASARMGFAKSSATTTRGRGTLGMVGIDGDADYA